MSHEWDRGIMNQSSWHGLEELRDLYTADDLIKAGEESGAWPTEVFRQDQTITLDDGFVIKGGQQAIIGRYLQHNPRWLGNVGSRFHATDPDKWRELMHACHKAGALPTGAFSLRSGSRVLATFELDGSNGLRNQLVVADCFDGSMKLTCGFTSIRVVCANTLSAAMSADGKGMAKLRHTSTLNEKVVILGNTMAEAIKSGQRIRELYQQAEQTFLHRDEAMELLYKLFPDPDEDASKASKTRAENKRKEALKAANLDINKVGSQPGNAATLWNAATFLVDRTFDDKDNIMPRKLRGGDRLDSMLFGTRGARVAEIEKVMIQVLQPDGSEVSMTVDQAVDAGLPPDQIGGQALIDSILNDMGQ